MYVDDTRCEMLCELLDQAADDPELDVDEKRIERYRELVKNRDLFNLWLIVERSKNGREFCPPGRVYLEAACMILDDGIFPDIDEMKISAIEPRYW